MNVDKKILAAVKKSFSKFDFSRLDEICKNEAQTRMYLIEPMCEMLGYSRSDAKDMLTEITAGWGEKRDLADIGLIIKGKKPEIIIECKKLGFKLTDKEGNQLNNYFNHTEGSKIGILTNGLEWRFYAEYLEKNKLHSNPFLVIDFTEIDDVKIEQFAQFHKNNPDPNFLAKILEEAQDTFFLEGFNGALAEELLNPSDDFIMPRGVVFSWIDHKTGKLAAPGAPGAIREAFLDDCFGCFSWAEAGYSSLGGVGGGDGVAFGGGVGGGGFDGEDCDAFWLFIDGDVHGYDALG